MKLLSTPGSDALEGSPLALGNDAMLDHCGTDQDAVRAAVYGSPFSYLWEDSRWSTKCCKEWAGNRVML